MVHGKRGLVEQIKKIALRFALFSLICFLVSCGEWESGATVGRANCTFGTFNDFLPSARLPVKFAAGNNGDNLYILDNSNYVHSYKRDNLYECAFNLVESYPINGFANDVLSANNTFYVQDNAYLKNKEGEQECYAKNGFFAFYANELAVGTNSGIETWNVGLNSCNKKANITSQKVLALTATSSNYYAVEGISNPQHLSMYSKNGNLIYSELFSSTPNNEENFCSASRVIANNYGVYILDKQCRKIGVFDNYAVWRKTIKLDSLGITNPIDIAPADYSYIFILQNNGVEKINVF